MAEIVLQAGARIDIPNRAEIRDTIGQELDARERQRARGIKWMRLPIYTGLPASSAVLIDSSSNGGVELGPEQGYIWTLTRIVIDGMTAGTTPDIINMYRNAVTAQPPLWQFNGNNFGYDWGKLRVTLMGGDTLKFASVGTFSATGLIRVSGELIEAPAEMMYKLL